MRSEQQVRWPEPDDFPTWVFRHVPHGWQYALAALLFAIAVVYLIYGYSTIRLAGQKRAVPGSYEFWLGSSFWGESLVYLLLGLAVLRGNGQHPLEFWVVLFFAVVGSPALVAFSYWVRDR